MTTKSKLMLVFGGLFLCFVVFIAGVFVFAFFISPSMAGRKAFELHKQRSAETEGKIVAVSQYKSSGDKYRGSTLNSTFTFQYVVNGTTYEQTKQTSGAESDPKKNNLKIKVCYDPGDPQSSDFYYAEENKICAQSRAANLNGK